MDWGQAKETAAGLGKKLLADLDKENKQKESNMEQRRQIWRQAVAMCEEDKASFKAELVATTQAIKKMSTPVALTSSMPGLTDTAAKYNDMYNELSGAGQTDAEDRANNKRNLKKFEEDVAKALGVAERNFEKAQALKKLLTQ